ncbi:MAG: carboxylating nicotinate-nucleotide diphosphorylase [Nitrospirales bacterium]|nr:carboxylating nicotinate-nucleotide diphosphorylase [Nitrospirales bacterium]
MNTFPPPRFHIQSAVNAALAEDIGTGDVTSCTLIPDDLFAQATVVAQQDLVIAGMDVARQVFETINSSMHMTALHADGDQVFTNTILLTVRGHARSILTAERVVLNFLQHLSGIATLTAQFCHATQDYPTKILDTRKTLPGLRALEKWAVRLGGGMNHRQALDDGILIKDNHLALLQSLNIDLTHACRMAKEHGPHGLRVSVEVESLEQVLQAIDGYADILLLDNMSPELVKEAVALVHGRAFLEVSGGITLNTVKAMAMTGVDAISIGALTHSAPAANLNMEIQPIQENNAHRMNHEESQRL